MNLQKMKSISLFLFVIIGSLGTNSKTYVGYIQLDYAGGPVDKPIPTIIFSVEKFNSSYDFIGYIYYVNRWELLSIKEVIEEGTMAQVTDITYVGYYNFLIVANGKKKLYITHDKKNTLALFERIINQIESKSEKSKIERAFSSSIISRIQ